MGVVQWLFSELKLVTDNLLSMINYLWAASDKYRFDTILSKCAVLQQKSNLKSPAWCIATGH